MKRHSIAHQAGIRLILSLGLFVALIALTSAGIYQAALSKAAHERAADLVSFYKARLAQLERDWEIQSRDFKVRIEFTRILEQPETAKAKLQAFLTIQGTGARFQYLLIQTRDGRKLFDYGKDLSLDAIPATADEALGHYSDQEGGRLYRVFQEPIWLGGKEGMGRYAVFFPMDNALLNQIGAPGMTLSLLHDGEPLASSGGQGAIDRLRRGGRSPEAEVRELPWLGGDADPFRLHMEAPVTTLFTTTELTLGMSAIPIVDGLILWFTIGIWLLRQTGRISELGHAVGEYSSAQRVTDALEQRLTRAGDGRSDEITEVAVAIGEMVEAIDQREGEREHAMALLRESEARIREITSSLADGVLVMGTDGLLTFVNPEAERLLGWSERELLGRDSHETLHHHTADGEPLSADDCLVHNAIRRGEPLRSELDHFIRRDGSLLPISLAATPIERGHQLVGAVITFQDITERLAAEQALTEAKAEAERANRAKSDFLANMSHEIRTPMNAIIGLSDLAIGLGEHPPKLRDYLVKIHTSSKALLSIINDILDYSKVEAGRLELDAVAFRLEEVLRNVADLFSVHAEEKGLEMTLELDPEAPHALVGDPLRLGQVMNNLVGNAVKFTEHGEIHIRVSEEARDDTSVVLRFCVRDTGMGMDEAQRARLFQAFTQADSSITRRFGGTGLGLTISQRLVTRMGGEIEVESQRGEGSRFSFAVRFPIAEQNDEHASPDALRGMRVLVVDDLETSRRILHDQLTVWGFEVTEAASGEEALGHLESGAEGAFELLLLDWKMPGMDGIGVARRLQELTRAGRIERPPVVIMVTAYSREQLLERAHGIALDAVLTKPVTASGLFDTIARLQGGVVREAFHSELPDLLARAAPIRGARLLLVEDNEINQTVAADLLERMGIESAVAAHGEEALERLQESEFDGVLMDLQMPVMDGFEATRRIRRQARFKELPVIAMTAAVLLRDREAAEAAGMNDHIAKPILVEELVEVLLKWLPHTGEPRSEPPPPCPRDTSPLPQGLPGFDQARMEQLLGGNGALFLKLARQFHEQFNATGEQLDRHLAAAEFKPAADLLHALKGAAGNLGAMTLHHAAQALEGALRTESSEGRAALDTALEEVLASLAQLPEHARPCAPAEGECERCDWRRATTLFSEMRGLMAENRFIPPELLAELHAKIACRALRDRIEQLGRRVDTLDYDGATTILDTIHCPEGHDLTGTGKGAP